MVAIVTGNGLGLQSSSALGLGARGQIGEASFGQTGEQIYVNAANGNLVIQDRDQLLLGQGVNSSLYRAYNSQGQLAGDNWRPGGMRTVDGLSGTLNAAGSTVSRTDWDGTAITYLYDATRHLYVATSGNGARNTLSFDAASSTWNWTDGTHHLTETYDAKAGGRLTAAADQDGNTIRYTYNAEGLLSRVMTATGDATYLDYNAAGQLVDLRTVYQNGGGLPATVTTVRYAYDAQGRLAQVIVDLSPDDNSIADGNVFTTTYTYDGTSSRIASIMQPDGSAVAFTYQPVGGDYRVSTIAQTSDAGVVRVTRLAYDLSSNTTTITDPLGAVTTLTYDAANRLTALNAPSGGYLFNYDSDGNVVRMRGAALDTVYRYDAQGNLVRMQDRDGRVIERTYGARNELLTETVYIVPETAFPPLSDPATTRYAYDAGNHLRFVVSPEGRVTEYRYNAAGQQVSALTHGGDLYRAAGVAEPELTAWVAALADRSKATRVDTAYDFRGNVASVIRYGRLLADGTGDLAAGEVIQMRYVYDPFGRLLQRYVGDVDRPQVEQITYDGLGRVLSATHLDGTLTLYRYDDARQQTIITFSHGLTRTSTYNLAGELIAVTDSSAGKLLSQTRNVYDRNGRLRMSTDAAGQATHYLYDAAGRRAAEIGPDDALTEYLYTMAGLVSQTIRYATPVGAAALATLVDANGRPVDMIAVGGKPVALTLANANLRPAASGADRSEWRSYDGDGRLTRAVNADGLFIFHRYDGAGRLIETIQFADPADLADSDPTAGNGLGDSPDDRHTRYFYDYDGLLRGQLDAEGYLTEYRYDAAGRRTETLRYATPTTEYKRAVGTLADLIPAVSANDEHQYFLYDARGLLRSEIDGEGYLTRYEYDAYGNVSQRVRGQQVDPAQLRAPQQVPVSFQAKAASEAGVGTTLEVWIDGVKAGSVTVGSTSYATYAITASNVVPLTNHTIEFRSPSEAQISVANGSFATRAFAAPGDAVLTGPVDGDPALHGARYTLDAAQTASSLASTPGQLEQTTYVYDAMGRLLERTQYSSSGNATSRYAYDDQGRVTSETTGDRTVSYRYDVQGRLSGQLSGEGSAALAALGAGATQAQIDNVWKSWGVSYAYDAAGHRTSMTDANGNATRYYYDAAGRLANVVNAAGEVIQYRYDAFGDVTQTTVYAARVAPETLGALAGGLLTDALRNTFAALDEGNASRTTFSYSRAGALSGRTDALGFTTRYAHNVFGELIATTQDLSSTTTVRNTIDYDRLGRVVRQTTDAGGLNLITQAVHDAFGRIVESVDANGVVRRQQYDRNGNVMVLTDGTGANSRMTYDAFGNMLARTDANGHTTSWSYTAFNREITVTTPEGIRTASSYNEAGQVIALTDGNGFTARYTYDRDGNLVEDNGAGATLTWVYDRAGQLLSERDPYGVRFSYSYDAAGRVLTRTIHPQDAMSAPLVTRFEYDAKGQVIRLTDPAGVVTETSYDLGGRVATVTIDPAGLRLQTVFTRDGLGRELTVTEGAGSGNPRVTQNVYDKAGRLASTTVDPAGLKLTTRYTYDGNGNVVSVTDAAGGATRYVYDAEGRETWSVGPTGAVVNTVYDAAGRVMARTAFAAPLAATPGTLSEADIVSRLTPQPQRDQTTRYVSDADGRVRYVINALNLVTEQVYDANGNVIRTVAYASPVSVAGHLTPDSVAGALAAQGIQAHAGDRTTRMVYDEANRLRVTIDALGYVTWYAYDRNHNLVEQTHFQMAWSGTGHPTVTAMYTWMQTYVVNTAPGNRTTDWFYDGANRLRFTVDSEDHVTENRYDATGRLAATVRYALAYPNAHDASAARFVAGIVQGAAPGTTAVTGFGYDGAGRLTSLTNALGVVTRYELDALGHAINTSVAEGLPEQSVTHAVYDAAGNLVEQTRAHGTPIAATTRFSYDGMGRVTQQVDPRGVELAEQDTAWALAQRKLLGYVDANGNGQRASALTADQKAGLLASYTTTHAYDAQGKLLRTTDPLGYATTNAYDAFGNVVETADQLGNLTRFSVDALNRVVQVTSPTGDTVYTQYDAFGQAVRVTEGGAVTLMEYDALGRLVKATDAMGYAERYAYDGFGNRIQYVNKLGATFRYTYDRRGLKTSETLPVTSNGKAVQNIFVYDERGNLLNTREAAGLPEERETVYGYDLLDRLVWKTGESVQATFADGTVRTVEPRETMAYDARGNLVASTDANGHTTTWYYDAANRKTGEVSPSGTLTLWTYDAAGNVVSSRVHADPVNATAGSQPPAPVDAANVRETRHVYDGNNRLTESRVMNVATGYFDSAAGEDQRGEYFITSGSELVSTWQYDGRGLLIVSTDPAGNRTTHFYDANGQKTLEVDPKGYGLAWTRDAQGNVTQEIRFAQPYPDPITANPSLGASLIGSWPRGADDRITTRTWDLNGRMTSESRQNVQFATVDANGKLTQLTGSATTAYVYDGEGHLVRKTDANGSQYDFTYDALGRQTAQMLPQFTDHRGQAVRTTTIYEYDGLNHVVKEIRRGDVDQVSTYAYDGATGRLASKTNALGVTTDFAYDAAGNLTRIRYFRSDADGREYDERTTIRYDAGNREVSRITQALDAGSGALVSGGVLREMRYNAYGEVTGRRTNGGGPNGEWQEYADYNNAGWVVRTNFDDGVSHLFMYDRNGNATLKVESMETDLRYRVITTGDDLVALLQSVDMMQTYTRYDARNQVIQIRQPKTSGSVPRISFSPVNIPIDGGKFANTQLTIAGGPKKMGRPVPGPVFPLEGGDVSVVGGNLQAGVTVSWTPGTTVESMSISVAALQAAYGLYDISAVVTYRGWGKQWYGGPNNQSTDGPFDTGTVTLPAVVATPDGAGTLLVPIGFGVASYNSYYAYATGPVNFEYTVQLYVTPRNQIAPPQLVGTLANSARLYDASNSGSIYNAPRNVLDSTAAVDVPVENTLSVARGTLPASAQGMLYYRPVAAPTANFQLLGKSIPSQPNSYSADISGLPDGDYEMIFMAVSDGSDGREPNTLLRRDGYIVHLRREGVSSVEQSDLPYYAESTRPGFAADSSGSYIWSAPQVLNLYSPRSIAGNLADHLVVRVRHLNDPNWLTEYPVGRDPATGAFTLDLSGFGPGDYEVAFDLYDANGNMLDSLRGTVGLPGGDQAPSFSLGYASDFRSTIVFNAQPSDTEYLMVSWEQDGETRYSKVTRWGNGDFTWDTMQDGLIPDPRFSYTYPVRFTAYDAFGRPLSMGEGNVTVSLNGTACVELTGSHRPTIFEFSPTGRGGLPLANVESLTLYYRESVLGDGDFSRPFVEVQIRRDGGGRFLFDASDLPTNVEYEYRYLAKDANGAVLLERESYFLTGTRNNPVTNVDIVGMIDQTAKDMTIDRLQHYNAFGEVDAERTGMGHWTYLSYNTMGLLTLRREPVVKVTLANGAQIEMAPQTSFHYDRVGNLVGLKDANGHLSTQQWNYGFAQAAVSRSWDAMGYSKVFQYDAVGNLRMSADELNRRTNYEYDAENRLIEIYRPVAMSGENPSMRSRDRYEYDSSGNRIAHTDAFGGRESTFYDSEGRIVKTVSAERREVLYDYRWASGVSSLGTAVSGGWIRTTTNANGMTMVDQTDLFGRLVAHTDLGGHVFRYSYNWAGLLTHQEGSSGQNVDYTYYSHGLVRSIVDHATRTQSLYEYDGDGNRTAEFFQSFGDVYRFAQATVEYDALNRVVAIRDDTYRVYYEYDAVGNRRRMQAEYTDMVGHHASVQEYWYEYDALNRFTVSMGSLSGARAVDPDDTTVSIVTGAAGGEGVQLGYNAAGERMLAVYAKDGRTERYTYDGLGRLTSQTINGVVAQQRTHDLLGRVTGLIERDVRTGQVVTDVTRRWDSENQQTSERDNLNHATTTYSRMADGTLTSVSTVPDDPGATRTTSTYAYEWWDGAKQSKVVTRATNPASPGWQPATTYYNYDANGNLKSTYDDGGGQAGNARAFRYWTDLRGQVQRRDELVAVTVDAGGTITGAAGDRKHNYYYLNGNRVGNQGNDGIDRVDYVQELAGKLGKGSESQYRVSTPVSGVDFDENYMAINGAYPGASPGQWTVRGGDTLQSVASALWGDATLWYLLAEANGLKGDDVLKAGQVLAVPNRVTNVHNTATTFKPYDPGQAIGNTQPTLPDPPPPPGKDGGCGAIAQILAIVVAVVVSVVTAGGASVLGAALIGAAGAAATQGIMIAAGEQQGFDWKGVAIGAVSGAVTAGIGSVVPADSFWSAAAQGAARSAVTQGASIAIGAQQGFDWKGVAAGAIANGAGYGVGQTTVGRTPVAGSFASGMAAGSASTLVRGGSLERDLGAISMDAVAATIGNMVVERVASASTSTLYGPGGNVDDMIRQAAQAYGGDQGTQFEQQANWNLSLQAGLREQAFVGGLQDRFGQLANDALDASRTQDEALKQQLSGEFASVANWSLAGQRAKHVAAAARNNTAGLDFGRGPNDWLDDSKPAGGNTILARLASDAQARSDARMDRLRTPGLTAFDDTPKLVAIDGNAARRASDDAAFLRFMDTQSNQPIGGLMANAAMQATGDAGYSVAVADAAGPLDALWAPGGIRASSLASLRRGVSANGLSFATTESVAVSGSRAIDLGKSYEIGVRGLYGDVPFQQRQYDAVVGGRYVEGVADNVVQIGGNRVAIEAKFVNVWEKSMRNPSSGKGAMPWAVTEQQTMLSQAMKYDAAFDQVIYHTNSVEFATHYSNVFSHAGVNNFKFVITPATR
ncbi:LysM peptidoglycan-binding domain-containing protein [Paraburkholderia terricola]|uniref:YD repeat-containing protein n=1 Tax=Paraburkholderia terricola TaxID=169427 RepID=A0ABU1LX18_9BURK|nr:LysM peptidoglycan-binding domain-containing protein [Paraburkholderia terricola]MDR6411297.1 YD repeat-containing protein [Paraburkholderia terricola]MDR6483463.1 YD repeat-containing protein [Paraburkholderia terricola]